MNFQGLKKIEDDRFYIDLAFRKATERVASFRGTKKSRGTRIEKSVKIELIRVDTVKDLLVDRLLAILKTFPSIDNLPNFYTELVKCTVEYVELKKSLASLKWAYIKIKEMHQDYSVKIKRCKDLQKISDYRKEFYGRVSSIMRQIKKQLCFIDNTRKIMKNFPAIKTETRTIAIAGFPNVGKSTLLSKLTGSTPDIQPYAFTTKGINVGYINGKDKLQLLDTPGTLNRFDRMNNIEKVAYLVLKMLAEKIIYVFDLTEPYPLDEQMKLYNNIKELKKPVLVYLSKTDILEKPDYEEFANKFHALSFEKLKEIISSE